MPLRPIDAIFVHPERRLYVVYYRGELWQLPRMKIDDTSWQRRQPFMGDSNSLYLSSHQSIKDPVLAQKLRTLNLPQAVRGVTLPRFEAWWEAHGFDWLKDKLTTGESPLAAHSDNNLSKTATDKPSSMTNTVMKNSMPQNKAPDSTAATKINSAKPSAAKRQASGDIFADMLADLADEVLNQ